MSRRKEGESEQQRTKRTNLHENVTVAVRKLPKDGALKTIHAFPRTRASQSKSQGVAPEPDANCRACRNSGSNRRNEVLAGNVALIDNKWMVDGNGACTRIEDGSFHKARFVGKIPLIAS